MAKTYDIFISHSWTYGDQYERLISYMSFGAITKNFHQFYGLISIAGMLICYSWYRLIRSYKDLNSGKFKLVHEIEKLLPISPFDDEWEIVGRGKDKTK